MRTVRAECLDGLLILNRRHLERVLGVYVEHGNAEGPHGALRLRPPNPSSAVTETTAVEIRRRDSSAASSDQYYRAAA